MVQDWLFQRQEVGQGDLDLAAPACDTVMCPDLRISYLGYLLLFDHQLPTAASQDLTSLGFGFLYYMVTTSPTCHCSGSVTSTRTAPDRTS